MIRHFKKKVFKQLVNTFLQARKLQNALLLHYFPSNINATHRTNAENFSFLKEEIHRLHELIDRDYCYLETPDYSNIGDHLIFLGSRRLLKGISHNQSYITPIASFDPSGIGQNDMIIIQGGGSFWGCLGRSSALPGVCGTTVPPE